MSFVNSSAIEKITRLINSLILSCSGTGTSYDFVDFFSGCGGMSSGFFEVGKLTGNFRHAGAFDVDKHANSTYEKNFGMQPDNLDLANASAEEIGSRLDRREGNPLVVIGCAPCQGFSAHRKKDPRRDERNNLVGKFGEIALSLNPEIVVMENVPDLLLEKHWKDYALFKDALEKGGYFVTAGIVNMASFGVPQERYRAVVLASRSFIPTLPEPILAPNEYVTVRQAIGYLPLLEAGQKDPDDPMHETSRHRKKTIELLSKIPKDGGSRPEGLGPSCLDKVAGFYDVYGRLRWDRPSVTITARCRTPSCGRFVHPEQNRGLSIREAALLQSFPENFIFEGPFDDKFKQIGNAVPPRFAMILSAHVLSMLNGRNRGTYDRWATLREPLRKASYRTKAKRKEQKCSLIMS